MAEAARKIQMYKQKVAPQILEISERDD